MTTRLCADTLLAGLMLLYKLPERRQRHLTMLVVGLSRFWIVSTIGSWSSHKPLVLVLSDLLTLVL